MNEFTSTEHFLASDTARAGISTIWESGLPIDLLVSPASSATTIFFFHGAIERHFTLPVLSGLGISGGLNANRVFISDPSLVLDETLMLAWYAGNYKQPNLQEILAVILKKVADSLNSDRVVFFGGSGGGFASLYFATHFENSLSLVFNPQTDIARYSQRAVRDFAVKAFGVSPDIEDPLIHLPPRLDTNVCEIYKRPRRTTVAYMQNQNDSSHLKSHLAPFARSVHAQTELLVLKEPWREGHSPPPKELLTRALDIAAFSDDWSRDFNDVGFRPPLK